MRLQDQKVLFVCHTCDNWFYEENGGLVQCPECTKQAEIYKNILDRHREECSHCHGVFEVIRKSPYENVHTLNCDNCMTILKINYADSILQKAISKVDLYDQDIGKSQINVYWDEIEDKLAPCLCGGLFHHANEKKCPFCLKDIDGIGQEYLIINNLKAKVTIPVISKHIWKNSNEKSRKNMLDESNTEPLIKAVASYMRTLKYFQELYYEGKKAWAENIADLKAYPRVTDLVSQYSFLENEKLVNQFFQFAFEIFPDTYHLVAFPLAKETNLAYLLQGKTGEIEIHPAT